MDVITMTKDNYEELANSGKTLLIDFWAPWCGPCKMLSPVVDEIAGEADGEAFSVCKVNVDDEQELAARFNVMSIPTLVVLKEGNPAATAVGVKPKQAILDMLN